MNPVILHLPPLSVTQIMCPTAGIVVFSVYKDIAIIYGELNCDERDHVAVVIDKNNSGGAAAGTRQ